jgi:hypothetical protein
VVIRPARRVSTHVFAGPTAIYGAFHGAEMLWEPGPTSTATAAGPTPAQMQRQRTRCRNGDPNGGSDPSGRRLPGDDVAIEFDDMARGLIQTIASPLRLLVAPCGVLRGGESLKPAASAPLQLWTDIHAGVGARLVDEAN